MRAIALIIAFYLAIVVFGVAYAIIGALPSQPDPVWTQPRTEGPPTALQGPNSWLDEFNHGLSFGTLGLGYVTLRQGLGRADHWRHADHWMTDVESRGGFGVIAMRPDRSFRFEAGKLTIETVVASRLDTYGTNVWPEVVITTAPGLTGERRDRLYLYDLFPGHYTLGCRLQPAIPEGFSPVCAFFDNTERGATNGGRIWEVSGFQRASGGSSSGGYASRTFPRVCYQSQGQDADTLCRDTWRFDLTATTLTVFVNGSQFFRATGLNLPSTFTSADLYTYFGTTLSAFGPVRAGEVVRTHWDTIRINDGAGVPVATPPPTPTPTATPSPSPSPTPTAPPLPTLYECWRIDGTASTLVWQQSTPGRSCP